jgi:hypothetical protein
MFRPAKAESDNMWRIILDHLSERGIKLHTPEGLYYLAGFGLGVATHNDNSGSPYPINTTLYYMESDQ